MIQVSKYESSSAIVLSQPRERTLTSKIDVDAAKRCTINCRYIVDPDMSWSTIGGAVTTAANNFAVVQSEEVADMDCSTSIELENLVGCRVCTASYNIRVAAGLLERSSIFTNVCPPYVFDSAMDSMIRYVLFWSDTANRRRSVAWPL